MSNTEIILHHYPQSPVAEKVRLGFGFKNVHWKSVIIPRIPPKPDLVALTGGYRRTPVMQINADVFCDSNCILRELEKRFPKPTFFPDGSNGMSWGIAQWMDEVVLPLTIKIVLGANIEKLDAAFLEDRARLYFGPDWSKENIISDVQHSFAQLSGHFGWLEQRLSDGRSYILGGEPGLPDIVCYYLLWFLQTRTKQGPVFISQFPNLLTWSKRVEAIGQGTAEEITAQQALATAAHSMPDVNLNLNVNTQVNDPQNLHTGQEVSVVPTSDGGDPAVHGLLTGLNREEIIVTHKSKNLGEIAVHFPRVGYRVESL